MPIRVHVMILIKSAADIPADLQAYLDRLDDLQAYFRRLIDGRLPTAEEIAAAPFIESYRFAYRAEPCLEGTVVGGRAPLTYTSSLWAYAPALGWARTFSHLYRLGRSCSVQTDRLQ